MSARPSEALRHFHRFQHHAARAADIETGLPSHKDWACVILFYADLHLLTAYFHTKALRFAAETHPERLAAIRRSPELRKVERSYRGLQDLSELIRYNADYLFEDLHYSEAKSLFQNLVATVLPKVKRKLGIA